MNQPDNNMLHPKFIRLDYSASMEKASLYSFLLAGPILIVLLAAYLFIWGVEQPLEDILALLDQPAMLFRANVLLLGILMIGTVIHELIHGITWCLVGQKPWSVIHFGFQVKTLTPYAHCREPLPLRTYRIGTWMPGFITGVLPALIGIAIGNIWFLLTGSLFVLAAGGDAFILWLLRKVDSTALVEDHPTRAGCYVLKEETE